MNTSSRPVAASGAAVESAAENLRFAIGDHQETIRGTDLKAEVLGVVIAGLLGVVAFEGPVSTSGANGWMGVIAILTSLCALLFVGFVIRPRTNPWKQVRLGDYKPTGALYPPAESDAQRDIPRATHDALITDWPSELTFELSKLAAIRGAKQMWFKWALIATGASILVIAARLFVPIASQLVR